MHLDYGWPVADLVIRGGWRKFESTQPYLNAGVYASVQVSLVPVLAQEARSLAGTWPWGLAIPAHLLERMPERIMSRFLRGGPGWGTSDARRAAPSAGDPSLRTTA